MNYKAVIFDLDGTVLLNELVYEAAFREVLAKHGAVLAKHRIGQDVVGDECSHQPGVGMEENWRKMIAEYGLPAEISINQLIAETQDAYHTRLSEVSIRPGFFKLHSTLTEKGVQIGLATSNDWWLVEDELTDFDLHKYFNTVVTREEVVLPKPAPDIFLMAARKLFVEPEECVVIEDSPAGIIAGRDAGMFSIGVMGSIVKREELELADFIVEGFEELTPELIDLLIHVG